MTQNSAKNGKWDQNTQIVKESIAILVSLLFEDHCYAADMMIILHNHASTSFEES